MGGYAAKPLKLLKGCCDRQLAGLMQCIMERLAEIAMAFTVRR
jgi:hypothetical protein